MSSIKILPLFISLHLICIYLSVCQGQIKLTEYKKMPALYKYDNFNDCMSGDKEAKYCMIFVQLQPDNDSTVWQQIETMNADKFNYRHDILFRGLCIERCKFIWQNNGLAKITEDGLLQNEHTQMFQQFYKSNLDLSMRYNYQQEIHQCINHDYMANYNLSTKTFINFCVDSQQIKKKDTYFSLSLLLIILLVLINILSTIYDGKIKPELFKKNGEINYYEVKHSDKASRYLTAFSLCRNYKRLVASNKSDIGVDLSFLDGFRAILCLLIVFEHGFLLQFLQVENSEFFENLWHHWLWKLLMHSLIWLELFFVLSGLLLYIKFERSQYVTPKSTFFDCVNVFVRLYVSRYLRFLPSLIFVIIFTAYITEYNGQNSLGRSLIDANCLACRESWWLNVLMINNFFVKSSCLMHTWYMAADFQLYGLFLIILIICSKYPELKVYILTGVAILAAAINFGFNYILKLEPIFMLRLESYRYFYFAGIKTARHLYFSSYTNIHSFLLGIICGFIYMKYLRRNPENKKQFGKILQKSHRIGWLCILGILYLGTTIMAQNETTIWTAAYGLLHRHVSLAIVAIIVILRGMCLGGGFLELPIFRFLARISFQVYLWQIVILLNLIVYCSEPLNQSIILLNMMGLFLYISSSLIGFVVALFVEYPIAEVLNIIDVESNKSQKLQKS